MQYSKLIICTTLIVAVGAIVEASRNYGANNANNHYHTAPAAAAQQHYGGGSGSMRYNGNKQHRYGPYHSYAARPALYGGHKMYHYRGYARHYPLPPLNNKKMQQYRPKSYGRRPQQHQHQKRNQRYAPKQQQQQQQQYNNHNSYAAPAPAYRNQNNNHYNTNNNNNNNNYAKPEHLPAGYTLKPIKALALVPISHGSQYFNHLVSAQNSYNDNNTKQKHYAGNAGGY